MSLRKLLIFFITAFILTSGSFHSLNAQDTKKAGSKVINFDFNETADRFDFKIVTDRQLTYTSYTTEAPWKLIMEFPLTDFGNFAGEKEVGRDGLKGYVIKHIGTSPNQIGRLEINFLNKPDYAIEKDKNSLSIYVKKTVTKAAAEAGKERVTSAEVISVNKLLYSGDRNKFVVILETSGKPDFMSYVLKNPLRIVFDIQNAKYEFGQYNFFTKNDVIRAIRVESFPSLSRIFLDVAKDTMPSFLAKAENDKLIIEFTTEEVIEKAKEVKVLEMVEFVPNNGRALFRFKGIGDKEFKVYKLKEDMLVFDFVGIGLHKDIQKTFDTRDVSNIIKSFTLYQLKPEEENKVRFVVDLKTAVPYKSSRSNGDILIEFLKGKAEKKETVQIKEPKETPVETKVAPPVAPPVVVAEKEEKPVQPVFEVEKKKEEIESKPAVKEPEEKKLEETKQEVQPPKEEIKPVAIQPEKESKKEEVKTVAEQPKPEPSKEIKKEEPVIKQIELKEEKPKIQEKLQETKPVVVAIKPKEEPKEEKPVIKKEETLSQYKGRPITINLKDAEIQHIFKLIAEVAKLDGEILNIVTSDDVRGKVSIQLEEVPWDQVLDVIMEVNNLGMKRIGNIIRVMPKDKLKKEQEDLLAASKIKEKLGNLVLEIVPVNYADASDFESKIKPLLSSRGSVTLDKRNNSLIINDLKENIDEVKKLIAKLDTPPQQVVIEARVVEANSDFSKEMGIQWGAKFFKDLNGGRYRAGFSGASTRTDPTGTATFPSGAGGNAAFDLTGTGATPVPYFVNLPAATGQGAGGGINFALINLRSGVGLDIQLTSMENKGVGKILSRPRITTLNNVEANIQQGSSIPYETLSDKGTQTQFIDANLMLTVTPRITPDNSIILKVKVSNNNPNTALRSSRGVPSIDKNEASTEILVRDGQTIVIGGIIRNKEGQVKSGVPFLMDIPIIGWLFKKEAKTVENRELLIFLTPNIIKNVVETEAS